MTILQTTLYRKKEDFIARTGQVPNLLIVPPNEEMDLNAMRIKVNQRIFGMRVIVSDTIDEITPALTVQ